AEAGAGADDDRVVPGEFLDPGDRGRLVELEPGLAGDLLGHELGNAADVDLGAGFAGALGDRFGHLFDVPVGGVVQDEDLGHGGLLCEGDGGNVRAPGRSTRCTAGMERSGRAATA